MAATPLELQIAPYRGGSATFDGAVTPVAVVPTTLKLRKTDAAQVAPNAAGYALALVAGWLYGCTVTDALVGIYYWWCEDADGNVIADGYIYIAADDTATYQAVGNYAGAFLQQCAEADQVLLDDGGTRKLTTYHRGTTTQIIPPKTAKQPDQTDLTNPSSQRLAGYQE